ncbi:MAG: amino acid--tRNA ligase-related protein, partial [bacterium]
DDGQPITTMGRALDTLFKLVEDSLLGPVLVCDYPIDLSPLAKRIPHAPHLTYRFEAFINGSEMGNAFSELNDPEDQRGRFLQQARERAAGDDEAMEIDEDFMVAMEHGMPPAGGLGIGIDRMVMTLTAAPSLREIILFPLLKDSGETTTVSVTVSPAEALFTLIEQAMAAQGWSPGKLMKELNVPKSDFNGWKKGERVPSPEQCAALSQALGISLEKLTAG